MSSATITTVLHRIEATRVVARQQRVHWTILTAAAIAIAICFILGCWQHFAALEYRYENAQWEAQQRDLLAKRDRLMLERAECQSAKTLLSAGGQLGLMPAQLGVRQSARSDQKTPNRAAAGATRGLD